MLIPTLEDGPVTVRAVRVRDARALERELLGNRPWLAKWEASSPAGSYVIDTKGSIRALLSNSRAGLGLPFLIEYNGEIAGQLNVSSISYGSVSSASIGYWVSERFAGHGITPTAVALVTDYVFSLLKLHRIEICIRPENAPSLRVVEKLGFRYEGLRRRYIHIDGDWRDHFCFALVAEEIPLGVHRRWKMGAVPPGVGTVPEHDLIASRN